MEPSRDYGLRLASIVEMIWLPIGLLSFFLFVTFTYVISVRLSAAAATVKQHP
jgi:hypothetical protein